MVSGEGAAVLFYDSLDFNAFTADFVENDGCQFRNEGQCHFLDRGQGLKQPDHQTRDQCHDKDGDRCDNGHPKPLTQDIEKLTFAL